MKSVHVDDIVHQKLKRLATERQQTLMTLLNQLLQEGLKRLEKLQDYPSPPTTSQDPVGMFGIGSRQQIEIEKLYSSDRYEGIGEEDGRF